MGVRGTAVPALLATAGGVVSTPGGRAADLTSDEPSEELAAKTKQAALVWPLVVPDNSPPEN
jgi:hypothetical protein